MAAFSSLTPTPVPMQCSGSFACFGSHPSLANRTDTTVEVVVARSQNYPNCSSRLCYLLGACETRSLEKRRLHKGCMFGTATSDHGPKWSYIIPATSMAGLECGVLQGRQVEGLKWYTYHCRPHLAMIVDLIVLPGLCFQSLSTFYYRFHCRPLNHFGLSVWHQTGKLWPLCVEQKQTRIKWTVGSK